MSSEPQEHKALGDLETLRVAGPDARTFLQGQLSADTRELGPARALLASLNSAQGRVQAILTLIDRGEDIVALVSADLLDATVARLRPYVLRAKVTISAAGDALRPIPLSAEQAGALAGGAALPAGPGAVLLTPAGPLIRWWDLQAPRFLLVGAGVPDPSLDAAWIRADVAAGLPQIGTATRESFVAQMLNLDLLGGISFSKGCYTGQEIIARTQYRGAIKRRMIRLAAAAPACAGDRVFDGAEPAGHVIRAARVGEGTEVLAVLNLGAITHSLSLAPGGAPLIRLTLPYPIPGEQSV